MSMTPAQCKMARAALDWSVRDLSKKAQVGSATVSRFEAGQGTPIPSTVGSMRRALEAAGVEFIPGGVRLREAADV